MVGGWYGWEDVGTPRGQSHGTVTPREGAAPDLEARVASRVLESVRVERQRLGPRAPCGHCWNFHN